jgi:hypothetical protein
MTSATDLALALEDNCPRSLVTHTTLYDLIAAINAEVHAEDDALVIACVVHLLNTQRLTYRGASSPHRLLAARQATRQRRKTSMTGRHKRSSSTALRGPTSRSDGVPRLRPQIVVGSCLQTPTTAGCGSPRLEVVRPAGEGGIG